MKNHSDLVARWAYSLMGSLAGWILNILGDVYQLFAFNILDFLFIFSLNFPSEGVPLWILIKIFDY